MYLRPLFSRSSRYSRLLVLAISFVLTISIAANASAVQAPDKAPTNFGYPLKSTKIIKGFQASANQYGPGHRGTDFEAAIGTPVYAIAPAQVVYVGTINGRGYITLNHGSNIESTYSVATKTVKMGDVVQKNQLIGTSGKPQENDAENTFHFSMRVNDKYVDPMLYITGTIPVREISLTEIKKPTKSWWQEHLEKGAKLIKAGLDVIGDSVGEMKSFADWLGSAASDEFDKLVNRAIDTYKNLNDLKNKALGYIDEMKDALGKGLKDVYNSAKDKLAALDSALSEAGKAAINAATGLKDFLVSVVKKSYSLGKNVGDLIIGIVKDKFDFVISVGKGIFNILKDPIVSAANATLKVLDHYFDLDKDAFENWMTNPVSCLLGNCTLPVKLACNPNASPSKVLSAKDGYKGSGNAVFIVPGLNSAGSPDAKDKKSHPTDIPYGKLGYSNDETQFFSYAGSGKNFNEDDTYQDINISVKLMDEQVKEFAKSHKGQKMDLLSHSLGGAVTSLWLAQYYDENNPNYPKLGKIVMFAPVLGGTELADLSSGITSSEKGAELQNILSKAPITGSLVPPSASPILKQLQEGGEIQKELADSNVGKKYTIYSLQVGNDLIVTSGTKALEGVRNVPIPDSGVLKNSSLSKYFSPSVLNAALAHSNIVKSDNAISQVQRILTNKKVACLGASGAADFVKNSVVVHTGETFVGESTKVGGKIGGN